MRIKTRMAFAMLGIFFCIPAPAQTWPAKPIRMIVPFPPGGGTDVVVRSMQPKLQEFLGQPVVIDNRSGAGGTIGSEIAAKAAPDGYTLGVGTTSTHAVSVSVYPRLAYKPLESFVPVGMIGTSPYVLATHPSVPASDLREFIAWLKLNPGKVNYASVGTGTVGHLITELFKSRTMTDMVHIPYKGAAPAYADLIGGHVRVLFDNPVGLLPYMRSGKIRAIAQTQRSTLLPETPLFEETAGLRDFNAELWYAVFAPAKTPAVVIQQFNLILAKAVNDRTVRADLLSKGVSPVTLSAEDLARKIRADIDLWGKIAKSTGTTLE